MVFKCIYLSEIEIKCIYIPGKWGKLFHSYERAQRMSYQPYNFARAFASAPFPWPLQTILHQHTIHWKSNQEHDEQQKLAKIVYVYWLTQSIAR